MTNVLTLMVDSSSAIFLMRSHKFDCSHFYSTQTLKNKAESWSHDVEFNENQTKAKEETEKKEFSGNVQKWPFLSPHYSPHIEI